MATIACVTSVTPDMVEVVNDGGTIRINIDALGLWLDGTTTPEQLQVLNHIGHKLLNAHDAIAAQARLFDGEA